MINEQQDRGINRAHFFRNIVKKLKYKKSPSVIKNKAPIMGIRGLTNQTYHIMENPLGCP